MAMRRNYDERDLNILKDAKAKARAAEPVEIGKNLWRKYKTVFKCLDTNNDGEISLVDYEEIAERLVKYSGVPENIANQIRNKMKVKWSDLHDEEEGKGPITDRVFAESILRRGRDMVIVTITYTFLLIFDCIDKEGVGWIDLEGFKVFHKLLNVDTSHSEECFNIIDANKDGKLTFVEFIEASLNYFLSDEKDSPYNLLIGPLVD